MKLFTFRTFAVACLLFLITGYATANEDPKITVGLKAEKTGEIITVDLRLNADNSIVTLSGGQFMDADGNLSASKTFSKERQYGLKIKANDGSTSIEIIGNIVEFSLGDSKELNEAVDGITLSTNKILQELRCDYTNFTVIDLSSLHDLKSLYLDFCPLSSIDLSNNLKLVNLSLSNTKLTSLDVSNLANLNNLDCSDTDIQNLVLPNHDKLEYLYCNNTKISELDLSSYTNLVELICSNTNITELDLSKNTGLNSLKCANIDINKLTLSANKLLEEIACYGTKIKELDLSEQTELATLFCNDTELSSLDISGKSKLSKLSCYNTLLTSEALDKIYCDLPDRSSNYSGIIMLNHATATEEYLENLKESSGSILEGKNWLPQKATDVSSVYPLEWMSELIAFNFFNGKNTCGGTPKEDENGEGEKDSKNPVESALLVSVRVAPNPCGAQLSVYETADVIAYSLINSVGQPVIAARNDGSAMLQLNTASLPAGVYLLRLEASDGVRALKVVKE